MICKRLKIIKNVGFERVPTPENRADYNVPICMACCSKGKRDNGIICEICTNEIPGDWDQKYQYVL